MSTIVGHLGLSRDADDRTQHMLRACARRASFNPRTFDVTSGGSFGAAGYAATSHSQGEPRPFHHRESGTTITADIRLDNRMELRRLLVPSGRAAGDAELALFAYLRWGTAFAEHLLGAFVIAIFDPRSNELVLCRDHLGVRPVLFAHGADWMVFSSSLQGVLAGSDRRYPVYIDKLQHALLDPLEVVEPETTVFQHIWRLPAASMLVWSFNKPPKTRRYWRPERPPTLQLNTDAEYQAAFRERFDEAVACRLDSVRPVASMLSGGLDSSTVVAAAQSMTPSPLRTYGFVESSPATGSDAPHVKAVESALPLDAVNFTEGDIAARYNLSEFVSDPDSIFDTFMSVLWMTSDHMAANGFGTVLTGIAGDEILAISARHRARTLLRSGRLVQAYRELAHLEGRRQPKAFARFLAAEAAPWLAPILGRRRKTGSRFETQLIEAGIDPISSAGKRLLASRSKIDSEPAWNTGDRRLDAIVRPMLTVGMERYDRVAARHGVEARHPLADIRLIEFCLSLPPEQLQRNGWSKWILRQSFAGELPDSVLWRPKELVGMVPATRQVRLVHGPKDPVEPPSADVFGPVGSLDAATSLGGQWERLVVATWWGLHGKS